MTTTSTDREIDNISINKQPTGAAIEKEMLHDVNCANLTIDLMVSITALNLQRIE